MKGNLPALKKIKELRAKLEEGPIEHTGTGPLISGEYNQEEDETTN